MSAETIAQMQLQPNAHLVHFEIDEGAFERAETVPQMQLQCAVPGCPERGGRDRQTDRQKDRDRQTDRQTGRRGPGGAVCLRRRRHVPKCGLDMPRRSVMPTPSTHLPLLLSVKRQIFCVGKG